MNALPLTRVMCVDDHAFLVEGLRSRLSMEPGLNFVGAMQSTDHLLEEVDRLRPDVLVMDIEVPGGDVFEIMNVLRKQHPEVKVLVLSAYVRDRYIDSAIQAGAAGYISKADKPQTIVDAIKLVSTGEKFYSPEALQRVRDDRAVPAVNGIVTTSRLHMLTPREQQILRLIGRGQSRTEIARSIHRSPKTIDAHRASIMEKLGIHDRVELARYAIREGLVEV